MEASLFREGEGQEILCGDETLFLSLPDSFKSSSEVSEFHSFSMFSFLGSLLNNRSGNWEVLLRFQKVEAIKKLGRVSGPNRVRIHCTFRSRTQCGAGCIRFVFGSIGCYFGNMDFMCNFFNTAQVHSLTIWNVAYILFRWYLRLSLCIYIITFTPRCNNLPMLYIPDNKVGIFSDVVMVIVFTSFYKQAIDHPKHL